MLHLWPTMADMFATLPPDEQAELICLADAYGIPAEPEDGTEGGTS